MAAIGGADNVHKEEEKLAEEEKILMSKLPKDRGWWSDQLHLYQYQGSWFYPGTSALRGVLRAQKYFKAKPSDIFLVSLPKSGTTWLKALVFAIMNRNKDGENLLMSSNPHECIPFLEFHQDDRWYNLLFGDNDSELCEKPRVLSTHMPITVLPASVMSSGSKVVYICRDPKDVLVSYWLFSLKIIAGLKEINSELKSSQPLSIQEAFDMFTRGVSPFGPFWDHLLGYWKASLDQPQRVLFLKYEDIKKEPLVYVNKLAQFLGFPFTASEEDQVKAKEIVELCSFESLSNLKVNKDGKFFESGIHKPNHIYFRRGEVGDWRNYLTQEMAQQLDQLTCQKLDGSGLVLV